MITKIINRKLKVTIVYEDEDIIAFFPLHIQGPVHLLIVPKKEIHTINEDAGQSVFHLHMHLLYGKTLGLLVTLAK